MGCCQKYREGRPALASSSLRPEWVDAEHLGDLRRRFVRLDGFDRDLGFQAGRVTLAGFGY